MGVFVGVYTDRYPFRPILRDRGHAISLLEIDGWRTPAGWVGQYCDGAFSQALIRSPPARFGVLMTTQRPADRSTQRHQAGSCRGQAGAGIATEQ